MQQVSAVLQEFVIVAAANDACFGKPPPPSTPKQKEPPEAAPLGSIKRETPYESRTAFATMWLLSFYI
jgi:hypothetical protein